MNQMCGPPFGASSTQSWPPSVDGAGVLLVRTQQDPAALAGAIRGVIRDRDPA